jgi:phosphoglycerol geranylgeranyltransferase
MTIRSDRFRAGGVGRSLFESAGRQGAAHLVLVDPDRSTPARAANLARECAEASADAILIGSSTPIRRDPTLILAALRGAADLPIILFPGAADQLFPGVDAVLFLSLLSGRDPRYLVEEQVRGAPKLLEWGIESIPTGYLLIGDSEESSVARTTGTSPLPTEPAARVVAHAQAAACLGMAMVYLEGGSGAPSPVPASLVRAVSRGAPLPVAVGGGIRHPSEAAALVGAGARIIVTGTAHERGLPVRPFTDAVHGAVVMV